MHRAASILEDFDLQPHYHHHLGLLSLIGCNEQDVEAINAMFAATEFEFDTPVYLQAGYEYAIVLVTESEKYLTLLKANGWFLLSKMVPTLQKKLEFLMKKIILIRNEIHENGKHVKILKCRWVKIIQPYSLLNR